MRNARTGQAVILLLLALGIFLLGAVGLAVESSLYYTHRQMAQAAADAAAQAAITSIYSRTNTGTNLMDGTPFTCDNGTDLRTPCHFARQHGFGGAGSADVIDVTFPESIPGVGDLSTETPAIVSVTISRPFTSSLTSLVGGQGATIRAQGTAAILIEISPVPILVMHPDEPEAMSINGNPEITICGGPPRSIQVNSVASSGGGAPLTASAANGNGNGNGNGGGTTGGTTGNGNNGGDSFVVSGGGNSNLIDLSGAGPGGSLLGCDGSGGEFGNHGGPFDFSAASNGYPGAQIFPVDGYLKTLPIDDPLAGPGQMTSDPAKPIDAEHNDAATYYIIPAGTAPCPATNKACRVYYPGNYPTGIAIQNEMALFRPGLYYMSDNGFTMHSNSAVQMFPCGNGADQVAPDPVYGCGMTVYNHPTDASDTISFSANSGALADDFSTTLTFGTQTIECFGTCFQGPPETAPTFGVVFMNDRSTNFAQINDLGGGGKLTIAGTLYFTNSFEPGKGDLAGDPAYQKLSLGGNSGSSTQILGQILVDSLNLGGTSGIKMTLNPFAVHPIRKLALIR